MNFLNGVGSRLKKTRLFDLQKELYEYFNSVVDILRKGCIEIRKPFLDTANISRPLPIHYNCGYIHCVHKVLHKFD